MGKVILIVEDDNDISQMLKELLAGQGYETVQAFSGTEALLCMEKQKMDGVILDLMLPGMAGEEVLCAIKETYPETSVIVSSARDDVRPGYPFCVPVRMIISLSPSTRRNCLQDWRQCSGAAQRQENSVIWLIRKKCWNIKISGFIQKISWSRYLLRRYL